jgi:aspartyl-tRNA(Asn)/glutamyl-tRNA(Gln) amidotransferase subunit A
MTDAGLSFLSIRDAAAGLRAKQHSPVELTQAYLDRIEAIDGNLHSFATVTADLALEQAQRAEQELRSGNDRGPLHGIPVALKDNFATEGIRTTCNSVAFQDWVPTYDATVTELLARAGAVLIGKNAMHELAFGTSTDTPFPPARNPWNTAYIPGGSSSGSGAAVAACLCLGAIGSDTGGSIRVPSSYCGIVGIKPTYGRISRHGLVPLSWSLDCGGPMARTVEDCAMLLQAIAGYDGNDTTSAKVGVSDYTVSLRDGVKVPRVGVPRLHWFDEERGLDPDVEAVFLTALNTLEGLGAEIIELDGRPFADATKANQIITVAEAYAYHQRRLDEPTKIGYSFRRKVLPGRFLTAFEYINAQRARSVFLTEVGTQFSRVDFFATPTMACPPQEFSDSVSIRQGITEHPSGYAADRPNFTAPFSLAGLPAISVPCGFTPDGMPVGLQLVAPHFEEGSLFRLAAEYEDHTKWFQRESKLCAGE